MQTRQLYASVTATTAGVTYVELPTSARIKSVELSITPVGSGTAADYILAEVSLNPANQTATNDAMGVLCAAGYTIGAAASAGTSSNVVALCDCQCKAGDRIYINATESGGSTFNVRAILHYS